MSDFAIEDGTGKGYRAKVNNKNQMETFAVSELHIAQKSRVDGLSFAWGNESYDYSAGDTIILLKNTATAYNIVLESVYMSSDTNTIAIAHCPTCATPTGTSVVGVNLNRGSSNEAESVCKADETTNTQENVIQRVLVTANQTFHWEIKETVILNPNNCFAIDFTTDGGLGIVNILGFFASINGN